MGRRRQAQKQQRQREIPLTPEMVDVLDQQRRKFVERFGREPGPDDLVFFDAPPLEQVEHATVQAMEQAGVNPAIIHAYKRTGRLVTEENVEFLSTEDLDEWNAAIDEYHDLYSASDHGGGEQDYF